VGNKGTNKEGREVRDRCGGGRNRGMAEGVGGRRTDGKG